MGCSGNGTAPSPRFQLPCHRFPPCGNGFFGSSRSGNREVWRRTTSMIMFEHLSICQKASAAENRGYSFRRLAQENWSCGRLFAPYPSLTSCQLDSYAKASPDTNFEAQKRSQPVCSDSARPFSKGSSSPAHKTILRDGCSANPARSESLWRPWFRVAARLTWRHPVSSTTAVRGRQSGWIRNGTRQPFSGRLRKSPDNRGQVCGGRNDGLIPVWLPSDMPCQIGESHRRFDGHAQSPHRASCLRGGAELQRPATDCTPGSFWLRRAAVVFLALLRPYDGGR
ncbi:hypothetical protein B0T14DRAFT_528978 [Immersiella caudata]|uniref:Uncharacterized protein n=1 Tax=Immersiella caudata TaxID=314043 RepID=A0AA39WG15_9PEZI|nr:hypothetical protein B0T14DRAFT_528978 [Immersiella caudata]